MNKLVEEAPYHPGYEDAVITPRTNPVYKGLDVRKMLWKSRPLSDEQIKQISLEHIDQRLDGEHFAYLEFAKAIEKAHGIK